ncbi:serum amyloid A protein-like [Stegodyphus dumicola]|uniref:serum amyloid A protein-like n=1 Tax=Stegodyphus dumicola TaxID=202533 RepID=UPI0015AC98FC|nr:serum amyloid A protein-like [Stegodyphus dumicola]
MSSVKALLCILVCFMAFVSSCRGDLESFANKAWQTGVRYAQQTRQAWQGAGDMFDAYMEMREANTIGADKYFHAKGNYNAAQRGPGGKWAAEVISDVREMLPFQSSGNRAADSILDKEANEWGRNGGDPNKYRPNYLNPKY